MSQRGDRKPTFSPDALPMFSGAAREQTFHLRDRDAPRDSDGANLGFTGKASAHRCLCSSREPQLSPHTPRSATESLPQNIALQPTELVIILVVGMPFRSYYTKTVSHHLQVSIPDAVLMIQYIW